MDNIDRPPRVEDPRLQVTRATQKFTNEAAARAANEFRNPLLAKRVSETTTVPVKLTPPPVEPLSLVNA